MIHLDRKAVIFHAVDKPDYTVGLCFCFISFTLPFTGYTWPYYDDSDQTGGKN